MLRNYFLINLILVAIIAILGLKLYDVSGQSVEIPTIVEGSKKVKKEIPSRRRDKVINPAAYEAISTLDLFKPSRSKSEKVEKVEEKAPPRNPPKLFGTIILNDIKTAILEDPDSKSTKTYRINDSVAGYVISDILEDKVVFLRDGDPFEVKLREDKGIKAPARRAIKRTPPKRTNRAVRKPRQRRPQRSRRAAPRRQPARTNPSPDIHQDLDEIQNIIDQEESPG